MAAAGRNGSQGEPLIWIWRHSWPPALLLRPAWDIAVSLQLSSRSFALSELVCTKKVFYPILLFPLLSYPKLLPLWSITDRRTTFFTPCSISYFFPLSVRGPTRRRNSTGLAEQWGGWPIEQVYFLQVFFTDYYIFIRTFQCTFISSSSLSGVAIEFPRKYKYYLRYKYTFYKYFLLITMHFHSYNLMYIH